MSISLSSSGELVRLRSSLHLSRSRYFVQHSYISRGTCLWITFGFIVTHHLAISAKITVRDAWTRSLRKKWLDDKTAQLRAFSCRYGPIIYPSISRIPETQFLFYHRFSRSCATLTTRLRSWLGLLRRWGAGSESKDQIPTSIG
jgi:hypothetical protein